MINLVDNDEAHRRFDFCRKCPELIRPTAQCKKCGCFMKVKVRIEGSECPLGKW
jgi:hypothetical protein